MSYCVSNMFGIRTGGVFGGRTDWEDARARIAKIIKEMRADDLQVDIEDDPAHCMSLELEAHKGAYIVLAGVFNYWTFEYSSLFASRLSSEFGTEVMHMCWDEQVDEVQCQVWLAGKPLFEVSENPIGRVLRHIG